MNEWKLFSETSENLFAPTGFSGKEDMSLPICQSRRGNRRVAFLFFARILDARACVFCLEIAHKVSQNVPRGTFNRRFREFPQKKEALRGVLPLVKLFQSNHSGHLHGYKSGSWRPLLFGTRRNHGRVSPSGARLLLRASV